MKLKRNRKGLYASLGLALCVMLGTGCETDNTEPDSRDTQFLTLHNNDAGRYGEGSYMSIMTVKKGEPEFSLIDIKVNQGATRGEQYFYPPEIRSLFSNVDALGGKIAMRLHGHFNAIEPSPRGNHVHAFRGVLIDYKKNTFEWLPLCNAGRPQHEYVHIEGYPRISESGHVAYVSGWNDRLYGDTWGMVAARFDPLRNDSTFTRNTLRFCREQPGGSSSSVATNSSDCFLSKDGKFLYGTANGFSWSGWVGRKDVQVLYKYDFTTQAYSRLGDATDNMVTLLGWTADKKWLFYRSNNTYKMLNLENNTVKEVTQQVPSPGALETPLNRARWNDAGYVMEGNRNIVYVNLAADVKVEIPAPDNVYFAQFSPDKGKVYFMLRSSRGNYLCRTSNLTENAKTDTICQLPEHVREFMVLR